MLDDYMDKQSLFCEEINNSIKNNKISHAYLIESNGYSDTDNLVIAFVKKIYSSYIEDKEKFENILALIDNNTFSDFMIVEPDGAWIKKEQILLIKEQFKTTSTEDWPRIYLIKNADKLNKYAANSLLKFLEEPDGNIIAILVVDNRYKVLETIRSRCQVYSLLNLEKIDDCENSDILNNIIDTLENKKEKSIAYFPIILENDYRNKEFWNDIFFNMINIYENAIRKKENLKFNDYGSILDLIIDFNSIDNIINKIDVLFTTINNLDYNLNITMMLDKFIIDFSRGD